MLRVSSDLSKILTWILALYLLFSGLEKINDPVGFSYQLQAVFEQIGLTFLNAAAISIVLAVALVEIVFFIFLLNAFQRKKSFSVIGLLCIAPLLWSLYVLLINEEASCRCFEEKQWVSFFRYLLASVIWFILYKYSPLLNIQNNIDKSKQKIIFASGISALLLGIYSINFLPFIDFSNFKKGDSLAVVQNSFKKDNPILIKHRATGEVKSMEEEEFSQSVFWNDKDWIPVKKKSANNFEKRSLDFTILDAGGNNYRREILENPFFNLVIVAYDLNTANVKALGELNALSVNLVEQFNTRTVLLTSSPESQISNFRKSYSFFPEIFFVQRPVAQSMIRSNPGILLMKDGVIIEKWHFNQVPDFDFLSEEYFNK